MVSNHGLLTRRAERIHKLSDTVYLGTHGFAGDTTQLVKVLQARMKIYKFNFHSDMTVNEVAGLLSRTLYYKRFFPYYVGCTLAGITSEGKGAVYNYDEIGCMEEVPFTADGESNEMIQPVFDNQLGGHQLADKSKQPVLTIERALSVLRDGFRSASERMTNTGDGLRVICLVHGQKAREELVPLRSD